MVSRKNAVEDEPILNIIRVITAYPITSTQGMQLFQLFRQGTGILIAIFLAKSSLSPLAVGQYEQVWFLSYALSFFWIFGMIQALLSYYPRLDAENQQKLLFIVGVVFMAVTLLLVSLLAFLPTVFLPVFSGRDDLPFFQWSILFLALQLPSFLIEYIYLLLQKPWHIVGYGTVSFSAQLLVVLLPVFLGLGIEISIVGLAVVAFVKCFWLVHLLIRYARMKWDSRLLRKWLYLALPLVLYGLLGGFMQTFNNWLVNFHFHGDERMFALFRYGAREFPLALALADGLNAALIPEIARNRQQGLEKIRRQSRQLMHTLYPMTLLLLLTSKWWFPALFSAVYLESIPVFNAFLLLLISRIVFTRTILSGLQDNNITLWISLAELLTTVLLGFWWIEKWGLVGLALANAVAYGLEKILQMFYLYRRHGILPSSYLDWVTWLVYTLALILSYWQVNSNWI